MMQLEILLFGIAREIAGSSKIQLSIDKPLTVNKLQEHLKELYPKLGELASFMIAVNQSYVAPETMINGTDEVAVIPPVSGG